jgi:hypothetical protein
VLDAALLLLAGLAWHERDDPGGRAGLDREGSIRGWRR